MTKDEVSAYAMAVIRTAIRHKLYGEEVDLQADWRAVRG
jgi:hypothetical protein